MNIQKRATKLPKVNIDENFILDVINRHSPPSALTSEEARTLAAAIVTEIRSALGRRGGRTTKARYGADHYSRIGKMGGRPPMKQAHETEK